MKRYAVAIILCALLRAALPVAAQTADASISGLVTDPSGAVVAGARVTATNSTTKEAQPATADERGRYKFSNLPPGLYTIEASSGNFQTLSKEVRLASGEAATLNFQLAIKHVTEAVTITENTRVEMERVPGSIALVPRTEIEQSRAHNLKDVLQFTPGVLAQPRFGADESQLSIRGSGLRNNFHARGLNILIDGIPYQDADGFSDYESLDLMATQRVEVWKGANALRFGGNSMGGAINFVTNTGEEASPLQFNVIGGSFGFFKGQVSSGGVKGPISYYISASDTELDGYREHSEQGRQRLFGNIKWTMTERTDLRFNVIYANVAEKLPGSLTREEFHADPRQADANNAIQDWGRFYNYVRAGAGLTHRPGDHHEIAFNIHGQYRSQDHPIFQVLDQDARNFGGEIRYRFDGRIADRGFRFIAGFAPQIGDTGESRFANINGRRGDLVGLFGTEARNYGLYFENQLDLSSAFTMIAGGRADWARRRFQDRFLSDGDRSDEKTYSAFSPKLGFVWRFIEDAQLFGNVSRSYEPPLLLELTSFGAPGFLDLEAQDTWQFEIGTRGRVGDRFNWDLAFFDAEINDELININVRPFPDAPFTIPSYRNAAKTRHLGVEVGTGARLAQDMLKDNDRLSWRTAYTWSRFRFARDAVFGNNYIPGAPRHLLRSELRYDHPGGFWVSPNIDWSPATYFTNSANTSRNDKYAALNLKAGYDWRKLGIFFEASNLTDKVYSASVQVDNEQGRFFEPANGRAAYMGLRVRF